MSKLDDYFKKEFKDPKVAEYELFVFKMRYPLKRGGMWVDPSARRLYKQIVGRYPKGGL